jgi:very-short-patch-repair endonuclease
MNLEQQVLQFIKEKPGQKAHDIAVRLGVERQKVNSVLYGKLKGLVFQDKRYKWWPKEISSRHAASEDTKQKHLNTPLARLCRYYLDCLSRDDVGGVSAFAESKYGDLDYVELSALPMLDEGSSDPFDSEFGQRLLGRVRRDRNRQTIFLGYPVRLNRIRSRRGWEGFMVEPLLLFQFQGDETRHGKMTISDDLPQVNFRALRALSNAGDSNLMEESIQLSEELGLSEVGSDQPDLDDLMVRLREIRSGWDWQEEPNPYVLNTDPPIASLKEQGIYNRAILVAAERSPYTKGLEVELGKLQTVEEEGYQGTSLGSWLTRKNIESVATEQKPLLEVLPLNSEQRQAVRQALSNQLTVITGPPGTGKSQVVTSILVNAAWQGKTVLFASKNNKAVDVVETRVNALGPRPVLLRLGANEYQANLAKYLVSLMAATATADDRQQYDECLKIHEKLRMGSESLDIELDSLVKLRNGVDKLEQAVETARKDLGPEVFKKVRHLDVATIQQASDRFTGAIRQADYSKQGFFTWLFWFFTKQGRYEQLAHETEAFGKIAAQIGAEVPQEQPDDTTIKEWVRLSQWLLERLMLVALIKEYFAKLNALTSARPLENVTEQRLSLTAEIAKNSETLWQSWLRLQPARMAPEQRKLLGDYGALIQMVVSADEQNQRVGREVYRRYYQLFPKITSILTCWAVTSLSARGRVPFESNFFDLLVIDEASQCDIASALPLLYRARRVAVIGDPQQLRHISTLSRQQDQQLLAKHGLIDDYPGWTYSTRSLFDLATSLCRSEDVVVLRDHHRSHADIIGFSNRYFYEGRLRLATNYDRLRMTSIDGPAVRWLDIRGGVVRPGTGGAVNDAEARAVVSELERLTAHGYRGSVGVVSPFRAQANRIRDLVNQNDVLVSHLGGLDFLADTVHKFQGDERDVMIFSPVVSSGITDSATRFLSGTPNLFNVAITRARSALIIVGDKAAALNCSVDYLKKFAAYVEGLGARQPSSQISPTDCLGPQYPPVSNPERVSDWERLFYADMYGVGLRPIPQYTVEKYVLDFAIIDGSRMLDIEVDGERYHRNWDGELCRRDQIRNQRLMELGWDVMRFWVYQLRDDLPMCLKRIEAWKQERSE